jgi:hypothetical protein
MESICGNVCISTPQIFLTRIVMVTGTLAVREFSEVLCGTGTVFSGQKWFVSLYVCYFPFPGTTPQFWAKSYCAELALMSFSL